MTQPESHEMQAMPEHGSSHEQWRSKTPSEVSDQPLARPVSATSSRTFREPPAAQTSVLPRRLIPIVIFLFYAVITLYPWIILCIANQKPVGFKKSSSYTELEADFRDGSGEELQKQLKRSENHIKAAQIVHSAASVVTIPVTSAVCSAAAVAFIQAGRMRTKLSLRQAAALADQGWVSPWVYKKLFTLGSLPLYVALGVTVVGSIAQILQGSLVGRETILAHDKDSWNYHFVYIRDVPKLFAEKNTRDWVARLRSRLERAHIDDPEPYLWGVTDKELSPGNRLSQSLGSSDRAFGGYFYVPLPTNFSTGVYPVTQHAPRIQTEVEYVNISEAEFPPECNGSVDGGFFVDYQTTWVYDRPIRLLACMPKDVTTSPWQPTYNRQNIIEVLYLNFTTGKEGELFRVTANSSLGYFELPSARNEQIMGPLLDEFHVAENQNTWSPIRKRESNTTAFGIENTALTDVANAGPLTQLAVALFGHGSYVHKYLSNPAAQKIDLLGWRDDGPEDKRVTGNCMVLKPLNGLLTVNYNGLMTCDSDWTLLDEDRIVSKVLDWMSAFNQVEEMAKVLERATFLVNKDWLASPSNRYLDSRKVYYDDGLPVVKVSMPLWGVILVSVLLGTHLLGLLLLACYVWWMKPWTDHLGAEVMVRMGASYADVLSSAEGKDQWKQTAAACPGFIGDERPGEPIGVMKFGAVPGLSRISWRKYEGPQ